MEQKYANTLLHIGYHKTGSTYLQNFLFQTVNGFSTETGKNRVQIVKDFVYPDNFKFDARQVEEEYLSYISKAHASGLRFVLSHERLSGYPPSGGYDRMLIAQRLADTFPGAKVLIIIREQRSLIRSMNSQYISDGGHLSLSGFLKKPEPQLGRMPYFRLEMYEFDQLISHYRSLFGQAQVLVLPFELMAFNLEDFLTRISVFSEIPPPASQPAVISNRRRPLMMQTVQRWGNRFLSDNELSRGALLPIARFPRRFGRLERVFHAISPKWSEDMLQSRLNRHVAAFVGSYYTESNARTSSMTGIDLQSFGYL